MKGICMMKKSLLSMVFTLGLFTSAAQALEYDLSVGLHDFVVRDIKNDVAADGIEAGTSHTVGINTAIYLKHTTPSGIKMLAKAEAFLDRDKDHLDADHYPVWFDFLITIDGTIHKINDKNSITWHLLMDNKQNTVSCIEREVRQHVGAGYEYTQGNLRLEASGYVGFYYIEIDDDTPAARGYTRQDTDDGEASNVLSLEGDYRLNADWSLSGYARHYAANAGFETLEQDYEIRLTYKGVGETFGEGSTLNLKVKHSAYDFDRFYRPNVGVPILPFDNDTLIQAYVTVPLHF